MTLILATHNPNKVRELTAILSGYRDKLGELSIKTLDEIGITEDAEETGATFEENALIKARVGADAGYVSIADDSGLEVDALSGEPGVYSARYSGGHGNDKENNLLVLRKLEGVPDERRTARFVSAIACVFPDGRSFTVRGTVEGMIQHEEIGTGGFGYDPLFYSFEARESFGILPPEEKNKISHRGRAIHLFCERLIQMMDGVCDADK